MALQKIEADLRKKTLSNKFYTYSFMYLLLSSAESSLSSDM